VPSGTLDAGDAGELLDPRARGQYRERVQSLDAELTEAREHNDPGRSARIQAELEFLEAELSRTLGSTCGAGCATPFGASRCNMRSAGSGWSAGSRLGSTVATDRDELPRARPLQRVSS
jgi:hypothetical protein